MENKEEIKNKIMMKTSLGKCFLITLQCLFLFVLGIFVLCGKFFEAVSEGYKRFLLSSYL